MFLAFSFFAGVKFTVAKEMLHRLFYNNRKNATCIQYIWKTSIFGFKFHDLDQEKHLREITNGYIQYTIKRS